MPDESGDGGFSNPFSYATEEEADASYEKTIKIDEMLKQMTPDQRHAWFQMTPAEQDEWYQMHLENEAELAFLGPDANI